MEHESATLLPLLLWSSLRESAAGGVVAESYDSESESDSELEPDSELLLLLSSSSSKIVFPGCIGRQQAYSGRLIFRNHYEFHYIRENLTTGPINAFTEHATAFDQVSLVEIR
jgi:hypothetical protein